MKTLLEYISESLFDNDLSTTHPTTLLDMFGHNITFNKVENAGSLGWTRQIYGKYVSKLWKDSGSPKLEGNLSGFNPVLQKLTAIILKNIIITDPKKTTRHIFDLLKQNESFQISDSDPQMIQIINTLDKEGILYKFFDDNDNPVSANDAWGVTIVVKHPNIFNRGWYKGIDEESVELSISITANYPYTGGCVIKLKIK